MRIVLLKSPVGGILGLEMITFVEPLGLECVAGCLEEEGHECRILDLRIDGVEKGMAKFRAFRPEMVGLQCNFTTERYRTLALARRIKREASQAFVVVGGHDASRDPGWFQNPLFDVVAIGDGEEIMPRLAEARERGVDLKSVPGLMLNRNGSASFTGPAPARKNLDDLPLPARHLIQEYADEYYINFRKPMALLETAIGFRKILSIASA